MAVSTTLPLLILDNFPISRFAHWKVMTKVFIKEGLWLGDWEGVARARKGYGSVRIPALLIQGLLENGTSFAHNYYATPALGQTAVVIKDMRALKWAIEQKQRGLISKLIAGPFIATLPTEYQGLLCSPEIDALLFLSEWHKALFARLGGASVPKQHTWFAGVDTQWWSPSSSTDSKKHVLIYQKTHRPEIVKKALILIEGAGLSPLFLEYGKYVPEEFRELLRQSLFSIFISQSETQGIAIFEAWSCGVPTLHYDPGTMNFLGTQYEGASSCAYLSPEAGLRFTDEKDLEVAFAEMVRIRPQLDPRKHIEANYTHDHSAERLLTIIEQVRNQKVRSPIGDSYEKEFGN